VIVCSTVLKLRQRRVGEQKVGGRLVGEAVGEAVEMRR
jgi:hypothetical protein